jgi:hypothetical protein
MSRQFIPRNALSDMTATGLSYPRNILLQIASN